MITNIEYLTAIEDNFTDLCKLKTFTWIQYLKEKNEIENVEFYNKDKIYISYDKTIKYIKFYGLIKKNNIYELILKYNDNYFFYNILYDEIIKNKLNKNKFSIPNELNNHKKFFYDEIISFTKIKEESVDNYILEKCNINIKCLFKSEIQIKEIELITKKKNHIIKKSVSSDYNNEIIKKKKILTLINNITFFYFYHYNLMPLSSMYGFIFSNNNLSNLIELDYYFFNPLK